MSIATGTTASPEAEALQARIRDLESTVDRLRDNARIQNARYEERVAAHKKDVMLVGERLNHYATENNWCSEYGDEVERVANRMTEGDAFKSTALTEGEWDVEVCVTREQTQTVTITVTARTADEAREKVDWDNLGDELDESNWENDDSDYEIEDISRS